MDAAVRPELHDLALKDLNGKSVQLELARNWITKCPNAAAMLEEIPERIIVDAEAGLGEKAGVGGLRANGRRGRSGRRGRRWMGPANGYSE